LRDEWLSEDLPQGRPLETVVYDLAHGPETHGVDHPPFVVEVLHDALEAVVFGSQQIDLGHLHLVLDDVGGACGGGLGGLDDLSLQPFRPFHVEEADVLGARARPSCSHELVAEGPVGDPLLGSRDLVEVTTLALGRDGLDGCNVRACEGLGDAETDLLVSADTVFENLHLDFIFREFLNGREPNIEPCLDAVSLPWLPDLTCFLVCNLLVELIQVFGFESTGQ